MKIFKRHQIAFEILKAIPVDLLICASGYEDRCTYLASRLDLPRIPKKIALGFTNENEFSSRKMNDSFFTQNEFDIIMCDINSESEISSFLGKAIDLSKDYCTVLVDYSSMSRIWYSTILKFFYYNQVSECQIRLIFSYSVSAFLESPKEDTYNVHIGPINGYSNLTIPQMPTGLIIGLGYEKSRAMGLNEYFDGETYVFYTEGKDDNRYSREVEINNAQLLSQVKSENIFKYSIYDISTLYSRLYSLCRDLKNDYRIILASCGPKTFALASLLIATELEYIDVWRISAGKSALPVNKKAIGDLVLFEVVLANKVGTESFGDNSVGTTFLGQ
jgi:hypothetical protein